MKRSDVAFVAAFAASLLVLALFGPLDQRIQMVGGDDFSKIWAGPRALVTGHDPYDASTWGRTAVDLGTFPPDTPVYLYPPWVAVAMAPLAVLPLEVATAVWVVGGLAAAAVALRYLAREYLGDRPTAHAAVAVTIVLSGPALSSLLTGQWSFLLVAAISGLVLALRGRRPALAALCSLAMLGKPQLFLYAAPAVALRALWPGSGHDRVPGARFVRLGAAAGLGLIAASALLVPSWWPAWPTHIGTAELGPEHVTVAGLLFRTLGDPGLVIGALLLICSVAVALQFHPRGPAWIPVWLTLSVAAAPYANAYDLLVLIVPLVVASGTLSLATRRGMIVFVAGEAILLIGATLLHDLALLSYAPIVPASLFGLIAAAFWDRRHEVATSGI